MDASLLLNLEIANKHYQVNTIFIEINNIISINTKNPWTVDIWNIGSDKRKWRMASEWHKKQFLVVD